MSLKFHDLSQFILEENNRILKNDQLAIIILCMNLNARANRACRNGVLITMVHISVL